MSDLFHELVPESFIAEVFRKMAAADRHTFQILTKRPERMREVLSVIFESDSELGNEPLRNVWLGTSIENARFASRADALRETPAAVRFISAEPLLGPIADTLDLAGIDWMIVGGESGTRHRPMRVEWARELRDRCNDEDVAFFFKQWGGRTPKAGGRLLDGVQHDGMPIQRELASA
jgi:protein gp37